jgi:hypothetical protein
MVGNVVFSRGGQLLAFYNLSEYEIWPDKRRGHVWEGPYKSKIDKFDESSKLFLYKNLEPSLERKFYLSFNDFSRELFRREFYQ